MSVHLSDEDLRKLSALEEALDSVARTNHYTSRGFVKVTGMGEAFTIGKLNLPNEIEWTTSSPKAHPYDHVLWTPSWVLLLMRAGYGDELVRCVTDENHRSLLVDAVSTMNNLKNAR